MRKKDKKVLCRILAAAILQAAVMLCRYFDLFPTLLVGNFDIFPLLLFFIPYFIIGYDILFRAGRNIAMGQVFDENFLMALATIGAFAVGEYAEAVFVMLFYQVGELFQSIAVGKSRRSVKSLLSIRADTAFIEGEGGALCEIDCAEIGVGDIICVKPGGRIPLDGIITEGATSLNTVALTGESLPRDVHEGDRVISGCVNLQGFIKVKVTHGLEESTVTKILALVESAAEHKSKSEQFITKFARIYTPIVVISAALLAVLPPLFLGMRDFAVWKEWILRAMSFLVISCPCALVISVPMSYFGGIGAASRMGILVKGSNYLDALAHCNSVVFDKTGTLTEGSFSVSEVEPVGDFDRSRLLSLAASAEKYSTHPIAMSIKAACVAENCAPCTEASQTEELSGLGVSALYEGKKLLCGNLRLMQSFEINLPEAHEESTATAVYLAFGKKYLGRILIADTVKQNAPAAMQELRQVGIKKTVMLSGDREAVARETADRLSLDAFRAELLPADKVTALECLLAEKSSSKSTLAYVGDGINDAPVLARADIGIAMGGLGSDAAIEAADIVLMNDDLRGIAKAIRLARHTRSIVIQNILFALGVKAAVLLLGAFGLVGLGAAIFADVGVAVIAILNAMRTMRGEKRQGFALHPPGNF